MPCLWYFRQRFSFHLSYSTLGVLHLSEDCCVSVMQISFRNIFKYCLTSILSLLLLELLWGLSWCASLWSLSWLSLVFCLFWFTTAFFSCSCLIWCLCTPCISLLISVTLFFISRHRVCFLCQMHCSFFTVICSLYLLHLSSFKDNFILFQNMLFCQVFQLSVLLFVHDTVFPHVFYSFWSYVYLEEQLLIHGESYMELWTVI